MANNGNRRNGKKLPHPGRGGHSPALWAEAKAMWVSGNHPKRVIADTLGVSRKHLYVKAAEEEWEADRVKVALSRQGRELQRVASVAGAESRQRHAALGEALMGYAAKGLREPPKFERAGEIATVAKAGADINARAIGLGERIEHTVSGRVEVVVEHIETVLAEFVVGLVASGAVAREDGEETVRRLVERINELADGAGDAVRREP